MFPLDLSFLYVCKPTVEITRNKRMIVPGHCKPLKMTCDREGNCKVFKIPELEKLDIYINNQDEN